LCFRGGCLCGDVSVSASASVSVDQCLVLEMSVGCLWDVCVHVEGVEVGGGAHTTRHGIQLVGEVLHVLDIGGAEALGAQ
jgi:hypothetical protein